MAKKSGGFDRFANRIADAAGQPAVFALACGIIVAWAASGPLFGFGDTWQLVINTGTTIITFLMVFVIQNTQNREAKATQIKLDELIRATEEAHNALLDLEDLSERDILEIRKRYVALVRKAHEEEEREIGEARDAGAG
ncbi:MAG: low affinity iron permease family protein [Sphingomonadales bacterium]